MCIIVSKAKGVEMPDKATLERCFNYNSDGAGLMYADNGKVNIVKGFMDFKSFYEYLMKLDKIHNLKEKALVMHFRISTGGNVDGGNCHPYPISPRKKDLRSKCLKTDLGMAHNGIISMYSSSYGKKEELNDTQRFIQRAVYPIYKSNKEFYKDYELMSLLEDIAESKLCFLDKDENVYYVGKFIEDNGVMYSNNSYMSYKTYPIGNYGYGYDYDDYEDLDWYYDPYARKSTKKTTKTFDVENMKHFGSEEPLTKAEFDYYLDFLTFLEQGTVVESKYDEIFIVDTPNAYALDPYYNLHYVDYEKHDIYELYEDCNIISYDGLDKDIDGDEVA